MYIFVSHITYFSSQNLFLFSSSFLQVVIGLEVVDAVEASIVARGGGDFDTAAHGTIIGGCSSFVTDGKCFQKIKSFLISLIMSFLISNFLLKKLVLDDFQCFLAFFDAQKFKLFLEVCSKLFLNVVFSKNHLECILKKFFEDFNFF